MAAVEPVSEQEVKILIEKSLKHGYFVRSLIALDMMANVIFLRGRLCETISSHAARAALLGKKWGIVVSYCLDFFSKNHGAGAIIGDQARADAIAKTESETGIVK